MASRFPWLIVLTKSIGVGMLVLPDVFNSSSEEKMSSAGSGGSGTDSIRALFCVESSSFTLFSKIVLHIANFFTFVTFGVSLILLSVSAKIYL